MEEDINFLRRFRDKDSNKLIGLNAEQFAQVWRHYDVNNRGYIEKKELDTFLREFITSVLSKNVGDGVISESAFSILKEEFMAAYDENEDDRIDIGELASMLPLETNFFMCFRRDTPLTSSHEFMRIWNQFDTDKSGFIEGGELTAFLTHFLTNELKLTLNGEMIEEYSKQILNLFDRNKDGRLQLSEMAQLLPVKNNFLSKTIFTNTFRLTNYDIERIFKKYDVDRSGFVDNEEILALLKDILEMCNEAYDTEHLIKLRQFVMDEWDFDGDGRISIDEFKMMLLEQRRIALKERNINDVLTEVL